MNPYLIQGPAQVGISGGRSSAYMGERIVQAHGGKLPPDVHFNFNNTGKEVEETLVFVAGEMNKQIRFKEIPASPDEEDIADCVCG